MNTFEISESFTPEHSDMIKHLINMFSEYIISIDTNIVIKINPNRLTEKTNIPSYIIHIKYGENLIKDINNDLLNGINNVAGIFLQQCECIHHFKKFIYNNEQDNHPDGHGECIYCGFIKKSIFPKSLQRQVPGSFSDSRFLAKENWDTNCYLQCGGNGLVLSKKKSYNTAFFEAFPEIDGMRSFIRGEGKDINEAEVEAWNKYQKFKSCDEHNFERTLNGKERTDGFGTCSLCQFSSSDALEPLTTCSICNVKTNNTVLEEIICTRDIINMGGANYSNYVFEQIKSDKRYNFLLKGAEFSYFVEYYFIKYYFIHLNEDIREFDKKSSTILHLSTTYGNYIRKNVFNMDTRMISKEYPDIDNKILLKYIEHLENNLLQFFKEYDKKEDENYENNFLKLIPNNN
jgi:hypothetical protein